MSSQNVNQVTWHVAGRDFQFQSPPLTAPLLMGIVNTTPDSFSDGGQFLAAESALAHALRLIDDGADIIDVGGQSTRPGSEPVPLDVELARAMPVIESLHRHSNVLISIDTSNAEVARQAIAAGANIVNDITAFRDDPAMIDVVRSCDVGIVIMHMQGTPKTTHIAPPHADVVVEVRTFLAERVAWLVAQGGSGDRIAVDPGIGFGKTAEHNLLLIRELNTLAGLGRPVCLGHSRKRFIGKILNRPVDERLIGTVAVAIAGYQRGANILRVHDVAAVRDAIAMVRAIEQQPTPDVG
jgi:dihydropteroate synthase